MTVDVTEPDWAGIHWIPAQPFSKYIVGGKAPTHLTDSYPFYNNKPLPFFASIKLDNEKTAYVFLDDNVDGSWAVENAANAVIIDSVAPEWITLGTLTHPAPQRLRKAYMPSGVLPHEPSWLQGDETPDGFMFVLEIPSNIDPKLNIGNGYGTVYIFINDDQTAGRIVWQS